MNEVHRGGWDHGRLETGCKKCGDDGSERLIERCVSCRALFCMSCAYRWNGKRFCSRPCAEIFFFSEEES